MPMVECEKCGSKMITAPDKPHPPCMKCMAAIKAFDIAWTGLLLKAKPCPKCGARSGEPCELDPSMDENGNSSEEKKKERFRHGASNEGLEDERRCPLTLTPVIAQAHHYIQMN